MSRGPVSAREREHARQLSEKCRQCGYARINVRHNILLKDQIEGPDYYRDTDLHEFVPKELPTE
jgi:hypothetical protein